MCSFLPFHFMLLPWVGGGGGVMDFPLGILIRSMGTPSGRQGTSDICTLSEAKLSVFVLYICCLYSLLLLLLQLCTS